MDGESIIFSDYRRHFSNIIEALLEILGGALKISGQTPVRGVITGSGGLSLADFVGLPFAQEVVAVSEAIALRAPETDVAVEIGGEDAKIIYLKGGLEQRMNGICAGGTGSFIDQMAALLQTDAAGLNELAKDFRVIYPIAARCGVFAKSDVQPLMNEGAAKPDLAVSVLQAVVTQTVSGLACGRPIRGRVAFLGGPLHFLSELKKRFIDVLKLTPEEVVSPENSHLFAALGAALRAADSEAASFTIDRLIAKLSEEKRPDFEIARLAPLFRDETERRAFSERHARARVKKIPLREYSGDAYLGIDAGSTTAKIALISENGELLHSFYGGNQGSPLTTVMNALTELSGKLPGSVNIRRSCVTGYGEALIKEALSVDMGEVETIAHYKAAAFFQPEVDFILDIGGQDMKCLRIRDGAVTDVLLNEACSAGCGSFIETFAKSLSHTVPDFAKIALSAENPIDLGSRCTVFMNSRVKQAQKEGAEVRDISAGLAYSVVKNALQKVIKITEPSQLGEHIVVQGGAFYNEAVLRAFELVSEREAVRPDIAGLMGAFGAALLAREAAREGSGALKNKLRIKGHTGLLSPESIKSLKIKTSMTRCKGCANSCLLTINSFSNKDGPAWKFVSGNRCEKGVGRSKKETSSVPNLFEYKLRRLFSYTPLPPEAAPRGLVGIPRVLNMYENYPLWFTFFTKLGYSVALSPQSSRGLYELGMESIPSESACYPAKISHGHVKWLIDQGVSLIFYPSVAYESKEFKNVDHHFNCPIVTSYPENIRNNMEEIRSVDFRNPFINLNDKKSLFKQLCGAFPEIPRGELSAALKAGFEEAAAFRRDVAAAGDEALEKIKRRKMRGIVLCGRPYHLDPEINHGIPELIAGYGIAVLTEDSVSHIREPEQVLFARDQWTYHSRLYRAAAFVAREADLELIQLNSFGCGLDAVTTDEVQEILSEHGRIYTCLKIDEVNNLGAARIRVRSLLAVSRERRPANPVKTALRKAERVIFTRAMRKTHTLLAPQMSPIHFDLLSEAFRASGYNLVMMPDYDRDAVDVGLRYVNNDACYPALIVVGQIMKALKSGQYDLDRVSVMITQTGGGCRASNYLGFIRRALGRAGLSHVPVISLSASGLEKNPGFKVTPGMLSKCAQALIYGDLLMRVLYRTRPYESFAGSAEGLYEKWRAICAENVKTGDMRAFRRNVCEIVREFDELPRVPAEKPRVGVVGEILVKFHPTANNDIVRQLENEGCEAVVPDLTDFFFYCLYNSTVKEKLFGGKRMTTVITDFCIKMLEGYRKDMKRALLRSRNFSPPAAIQELGVLAAPIVSLGNQTGEGWFLTAEIMELIGGGVNNIVCTQPFACLPNHVTGKGIIKKVKEFYPLSNIVAVDYDPGASEVNQLNRIKLMIETARRGRAKNLEPPSAVF
jgi:predicted CoA-substrate-specific enzyme activase